MINKSFGPFKIWHLTLSGSILAICAISFSLYTIFHEEPAQGRVAGSKISFQDISVKNEAVQRYDWAIQKNVTPLNFNLVSGDTAIASYSITTEKHEAVVKNTQSGTVCIQNDGVADTMNLSVTAQILELVQGANNYVIIATTPVDVSSNPDLAPGENGCYPVNISFQSNSISQYTIAIKAQTDNFISPPIDSPQCDGTPCQSYILSSTDIQLASDITKQFETINVDDSNGQTLTFDDSDTKTYQSTYTCDQDSGSKENSARIREITSIAPAKTTIQVNCSTPTIANTNTLDSNRTYYWTLDKTVDQPSPTLSINQSSQVNYSITASAVTGASTWTMNGTLSISNPTSRTIHVTALTSIIGSNQGSVTCNKDFPFDIESDQTMNCQYQHELPNSNSTTQTIKLTIGKYSYDAEGNPSSNGFTEIVTSNNIDYSLATQHDIDACVTLSDSRKGDLGSVCQADLVNGKKTISYRSAIGPYSTCGRQAAILNTATLNGTLAKAASNASVTPSVACQTQTNCIRDIDYWTDRCDSRTKNNNISGFLPIWLGNQNSSKGLLIDSANKAKSVFSQNTYGNKSNGITELYAELLTAKTNVKSGASSANITSTINAADAFLSGKNYNDYNKLSKSEKSDIAKWNDKLHTYNSGSYGIKYCKDNDDRDDWHKDDDDRGNYDRNRR